MLVYYEYDPKTGAFVLFNFICNRYYNGNLVGLMNLPVYYRCPAGYCVAVIRDALNDAPETWPVEGRSIFEWCNDCDKVGEDGVCVLRYEVRV